jgi:transcriptional regulator with XRE-family HTH domain
MLILIDMHIGKNIRALRKKAGLTQEQLAEALGIRQQMIADYERCKVNPEVSKLPALAKALGASVGELFQVEAREGATAAPIRRKNRRDIQAQEIFLQLKPEEQRIILKHMRILADGKR